MISKPFTNIFADGEVAGRNPDAVDDYYKITDAQVDHNYLHLQIAKAIKLLSTQPTKDYFIIYGGQISDAGSGAINITEGAAITVDNSGNPRIVYMPALSSVNVPSGFKDGRQLWIISKYDFKYGSATRNHYIGTSYHYQLEDTYYGDTNGYASGSTDDLFVDSDPNSGSESVTVWGSFSMTAGNVFTDLSSGERTRMLSMPNSILALDQSCSYAPYYVQSSAPSSPYHGWLWYDTDDNKLYQYNAYKSDWLEINWQKAVEATPEWQSGALRISSGILQITPNSGTNWYNCYPALGAKNIKIMDETKKYFTLEGIYILLVSKNVIPIVFAQTHVTIFQYSVKPDSYSSLLSISGVSASSGNYYTHYNIVTVGHSAYSGTSTTLGLAFYTQSYAEGQIYIYNGVVNSITNERTFDGSTYWGVRQIAYSLSVATTGYYLGTLSESKTVIVRKEATI